MTHGSPRILCISPLFPPVADSEAFCGGKMVLALQEAGADVTVLYDSPLPTTKTDRSSSWDRLADLCHPVDIHRTWNKPWAFVLGGRYRALRMGRLVHSYVKKALQLNREKPFHFVYSRSLPMCAHIIGYWCSRVLGIPWVANVNDPWDLHLFPDVDQKPPSWTHGVISRYWLRKTLAEASLVTYPSARLRDFHVRLSGVPHRSEVISHVGWACDLASRPQPCLHLVHAGKLVDKISNRNSKPLLLGLQQFFSHHPEARADVRMTLVGPDDADSKELLRELGLQNVITSTGRVSYGESLKHINEASVCVLVEGNMREGIYLASKVTDYAAAGRPILALSPARGVIADMLPCRGIVRVDLDNVDAIAQAIGHFHQLYKAGKIQDEHLTDEFVSQFKPAQVAARFFHCVSDAIPELSQLHPCAELEKSVTAGAGRQANVGG